ncbi:hypothetical protein M0R45_000379 [Rubus argutus]|uniref:Uncharacterized protein n=1 Tax=Rubus argutus TaxID=59490 RepID=A0AAW1VNB3_RUBAR
MAQAVSFLNDFKLGHYMKIPPRSMFLVQLIGTILAGTINLWKQWWQRYNYVLSAALDAGVAFMAVLMYLSVGVENTSLTWWGTKGEHCDLASCPTAKGIVVDGCPVN